uniref:Uncharacterized protein n=1 Tax=Panagrellus redivivus TaxID=6233 RepID=A0A7E4W1E9_PANRE
MSTLKVQSARCRVAKGAAGSHDKKNTVWVHVFCFMAYIGSVESVSSGRAQFSVSQARDTRTLWAISRTRSKKEVSK